VEAIENESQIHTGDAVLACVTGWFKVVGVAVATMGGGPAPAGAAVSAVAAIPPWTGAPAEDSVPEALVPRWDAVEVTGLSVTEGAYAGGGGGLLQLVTVGVESELGGGFTAHLDAQGKWGHDGAPFPSEQGLSSLDAGDFGGVGEAWLEWRSGKRVRVKAGRVDANSEFAASESAGSFANPSFGLSPVLALLPSYPEPAPSANVFVGSASGGLGAGTGLYRGPEGAWVGVAELGGAVPRLPAVRWSAGWATPLGAGSEGAGEAGAYLIVERPSEDALSPFVVVSRSTDGGPSHLAGGVTLPAWEGPVTVETGLGASALLAREWDEAVAEAYVTVRPVPWVAVQGDVQLRVADGQAGALAGLIRVAVEY
jgi:hypothetical protein